MGAATNYRRAAGRRAPLVLRSLYFDDQDFGFFTYTATGPGPFSGWNHVQGNWPGDGAYGNTISYCHMVLAGQTLSFTTRAFVTTGQVDEGPVFNIANEGVGPIAVYIDGAYLTTIKNLGAYDSLHSRLYDMRRQGAEYNDLQYGNSFLPFRTTSLFPAGAHTVTFVKLYNDDNYPGQPGAKACYFDGCTIYTYDRNFT